MGAWGHWFAGCWWVFLIFMFIMVVACMFCMRRCFCMPGRHDSGEKLRRYPGDSAEDEPSDRDRGPNGAVENRKI